MILGLIALVVLLGFGNTIFDLVCPRPKGGGERCCLCFSPKSPVELASECVVARCENGCNSAEVENIKSLDFSCSNYCDPVIIDFIETDWVCGFQFPIVIELEGKSMEVKQSEIEGNYQCFAKFTQDKKDVLKYLTTSYTSLAIKDEDIIKENSDPEGFACAPGIGEEIGDFKTNDEGTLIIYGDIDAFATISNGGPYVERYPGGRVTFVSNDFFDYGIFNELPVGTEQEIILVYQEYYPLEYIVTQNTGIIVKDVISGGVNECENPADTLVKLDVLCDGRFEGQKLFCDQNENLKEHTICEGLYRIRSVLLPPYSGYVSENPYVFTITRLK